MLAVLEDALAACKRAPPPARPSVAGCSLRLMLGSPTARLGPLHGCGPFGFEAVCDALGIQPNRLRDRIREWVCNYRPGRAPTA